MMLTVHSTLKIIFEFFTGVLFHTDSFALIWAKLQTRFELFSAEIALLQLG